MSDAVPTSPLKKPTVAPAHFAGGMRVGDPHPHPKASEGSSKELTDAEKKQAAHDALALSNQLYEIDAVMKEDRKHQSDGSKAVASVFHPTAGDKAYQNNHKNYGGKGHVQQPGGAHACNNYLH